jgi:hypothetical protein
MLKKILLVAAVAVASTLSFQLGNMTTARAKAVSLPAPAAADESECVPGMCMGVDCFRPPSWLHYECCC